METTKDTFVRKIEVEQNDGNCTELSIHQMNIGDVGCVVWDAALVLAYYIQTVNARRKFIFNQNVIELGSGTGIVGLVAAACGARDVVVTDLPELLPLLNKNIQENSVALNGAKYIKACCYHWGKKEDFNAITEVESNMKKHKFECVLIADCIYYDSAVEPLASSINHIISTSAINCHVLCSYEERDTRCKRELLETFKSLITNKFNLKIAYIPFKDMHNDFRSHDIYIMYITK